MRRDTLQLFLGMVLLAAGTTARGDFVTLTPAKDNTIFEGGDLSAAVGSLYSGRTGSNDAFTLRRALMEFDVATAIPAGAVIESATLTMALTKRSPIASGGAGYSIYPVLKEWGEGTSTSSGAGNAATVGDATWSHTFYSTASWDQPGGDFSNIASQSITMDDPALYTFPTAPEMVDVIQAWLDSPSSNHGWILVCEDDSANSARQFDSRESAIAANRPTLTVTYSVPEPGVGIAVIMLVAAVGTRRRRSATI